MNIDYDKIEELYGVDCLILLKENIEEVKKNINYLYKLGFNDIEDIFERYTYIFIRDYETFKKKLDKLIIRLGENYVNEIETNLNLLEELE